MGGGYQIKVKETESAGTALTDLKSCVDAAHTDLTQGITLPAPEAGETIAPEVKNMIAAWHEALPDLSKEVDQLGKNVKATATVVVEVEQNIRNRYAPFAS